MQIECFGLGSTTVVSRCFAVSSSGKAIIKCFINCRNPMVFQLMDLHSCEVFSIARVLKASHKPVFTVAVLEMH